MSTKKNHLSLVVNNLAQDDEKTKSVAAHPSNVSKPKRKSRGKLPRKKPSPGGPLSDITVSVSEISELDQDTADISIKTYAVSVPVILEEALKIIVKNSAKNPHSSIADHIDLVKQRLAICICDESSDLHVVNDHY